MERRIFDFHTHAFPDAIAAKTIAFLSKKGGIPPFSDGSVEGLRKVLKNAGICKGLVLPVVTKPEQFDSVNRFAAALNQEENVLVSFGGIHPDNDNPKERIRQLKQMGFAGIKIHPDYQGVDFDDIRYLRILEAATEYDLAIVTHAGIDIGFPDDIRCTPKRVQNVLREVQPKKLVLAHGGGYELWDEVLDSLCGADVWMDTAFCMGRMPDEKFIALVRKHGADRILFATDCPWGDPAYFAEHFLSLTLSKDEQEKILWNNAENLLKKG